MPNYLYRCSTCGSEVNLNHSIKEDPEILCEVDNSVMKRVIFPPVISYVGEGWTRKESANKSAGIPSEVAKTAERLGKL